MSEYLIQSETLKAIADAVRSKMGSEDKLTPAQMAAQIDALQVGGFGLYSKAQMVTWNSGEATSIDYETIEHSLGVVPDGMLMIQRSATSSTHVGSILCIDRFNACGDTFGTGNAICATYIEMSKDGIYQNSYQLERMKWETYFKETNIMLPFYISTTKNTEYAILLYKW